MMIRITALFLVVATFTTINVEACSTNYNFDYFLLATQWPESFCESTSCVAHKDKWAIHGAWPERNDGSWPQNCCTKKPYDGSLLKSIHDDLVANWGTLKSGGTNDQFWSHEYMKHGTCSIDSPLMKDELSYFKNSLDAFHKLKIDQWLADANIVPSKTKTYPLADIHEAIRKGLGHKVQIDCIKNKHHKFPIISQINFCLDKETLAPFDCKLNDRSCKHGSIGYLSSH